MNQDTVYSKLAAYFDWEKTFDFSGWKDIEIVTGDSLVDAWIKARPKDAYKFEDPAFRQNVMSANGKWLEKQFESDKYKVLVATGDERSEDEICEVLAHELRHCLDYQAAVKGLSFDEYHPGNRFYNCWSEFRATSVSVRYEAYLRFTHNADWFATLSEMLGFWNADCVEGLYRAGDNSKQQLYYISRYVGASRAIRNLNSEYNVNASAFTHWYMTPTYITEKYSYVFYLGNEWDERQTCSLDAKAETYYFNELCEKLHLNN